jgi:hypothetical protein
MSYDFGMTMLLGERQRTTWSERLYWCRVEVA